MSPILNGSFALERFERGNAIEIHNGMMFDFYPGLPQMWKQLTPFEVWEWGSGVASLQKLHFNRQLSCSLVARHSVFNFLQWSNPGWWGRPGSNANITLFESSSTYYGFIIYVWIDQACVGGQVISSVTSLTSYALSVASFRVKLLWSSRFLSVRAPLLGCSQNRLNWYNRRKVLWISLSQLEIKTFCCTRCSKYLHWENHSALVPSLRRGLSPQLRF